MDYVDVCDWGSGINAARGEFLGTFFLGSGCIDCSQKLFGRRKDKGRKLYTA